MGTNDYSLNKILILLIHKLARKKYAVLDLLIPIGTVLATAVIAQLGERQTEDLKVPGSIPGRGIVLHHIRLLYIY